VRRTYMATEKMLSPWSQQARQLTPRGGTVAHLGNQGCCCVHIHTGESIKGEYAERINNNGIKFMFSRGSADKRVHLEHLEQSGAAHLLSNPE